MAERRHTRRAAVRRKAATADVIGASPRRDKVPGKWKKQHERLMRMRDFLLLQKSDLAKDATAEAAAFSLHMADAGTDSFDRDLALSRLSAEQDALYEIDQAINRIRDGTYGICELTGKPVEPARLEAIPWTRFSADAEKRLEKEGAVQRSRLPPPESVAHEPGRGDGAGGVADETESE